MKLGVFDSGVGGEAVAAALQKTFPNAEIVTINDRKNVPYGNKTAEQVIQLTDRAIQPLLDDKCDIIILACNTATALAITDLRTKYPHQLFIGIEPMIKSAAQLTKSRVVAVCATPATLASTRYKDLLNKYATNITIHQPDCSEWASLIENNQINREHISDQINTACEHGADVIVLGCTHYHWIKDLIIDLVDGRAEVIEPSEAIGRRVQQLLTQR